MHLADKMIRILQQQRVDDIRVRSSKNGEAVREFWRKYPEAWMHGSDARAIPAEITEVDRLCVLVAAACHDLGHGPYSHMFELVTKSLKASWTHEEMSVKLLRHTIATCDIDLAAYGLDPERDLRFIEELIVGSDLRDEVTGEKVGAAGRRGRGADKSFLYDIVNNVHSGLDVDKVPRAPARRPLCCLLAQASGCCHRT
jgi:HD superfamily phosphohydrolase